MHEALTFYTITSTVTCSRGPWVADANHDPCVRLRASHVRDAESFASRKDMQPRLSLKCCG